METSDIIATIGVTLLLIAFFLQSLKVIKSESVTYNLLNFMGAAIASYASYLIPFLPFVILEAVWSMVALYGLIKIIKQNSVSR
ncbi:MAG: hypothetical protein REI78_05845 [Pedobacter sp.]|nr:hypothetical protein [Pedobacter sp.]MDQ8052525.1 hypothetical protein [Pedobacter sp.]